MAVDRDIQEEIAELFSQGMTRPRDIIKRLEVNDAYKNRVPSDRTIYRLLSEFKKLYSEEQKFLDTPFAIRRELSAGVSQEDLPTILQLMRNASIRPYAEMITHRDAAWIAVLRHTSLGLTEYWQELWRISALYSRRERWALLSEREFNTSDLDMLVAYETWVSDINASVYNLALLLSTVQSEFWLESEIEEHSLEPRPPYKSATLWTNPVNFAINKYVEELSPELSDIFYLALRSQRYSVVDGDEVEASHLIDLAARLRDFFKDIDIHEFNSHTFVLELMKWSATCERKHKTTEQE